MYVQAFVSSSSVLLEVRIPPQSVCVSAAAAHAAASSGTDRVAVSVHIVPPGPALSHALSWMVSMYHWTSSPSPGVGSFSLHPAT